MKDKLKQIIYKLFRPIYRPITRYLRKRLTRNFIDYPEMGLPGPWDFTQLQVERRLHEYLHAVREDIGLIIIIGANDGAEIPKLRFSYPKSSFICFEPSPKWFDCLGRNYSGHNGIKLKQLAISDQIGRATFHELNMPGNGSLLKPNIDDWALFNHWENKSVEMFEVEVSTLDAQTNEIECIDLLWVDVQGGEGGVLRGGLRTLEKTKSVFLEVALERSPYQGALLFQELDSTLSSLGFRCVSLGLDPWNYTGNAFWVKKPADLVCK